jgi:hypothetical protein
MKELIVHIGGSKCASSSIQNLFTQNALFHKDGRSFKYIGYDANDKIINSNIIAEESNFPPHFFTTNISAEPKKLKTQLKSVIKDKCDVAIISNEGLANPEWLTDEAFDCFASNKFEISIYYAVRRHDHWLNSSWWQWGAFSETSLDRWIENEKLSAKYLGVEKWLKLPNIKEFHCVDLQDGPVEIIATKLGIVNYDKSVINSASSAEMLRFLIKNKSNLNRTVHSPLIEFILNNELNYSGEKPPFVISREKQISILHDYETALSLNLDNNIKRVFSNHLTQLTEDLGRNKSKKGKSDYFSMSDFLNEPSSPKFLGRLNELLVNRLHVPLEFSAEHYLYLNPDVRATGVNPYQHYLEFGIKEGRRIR